MRDWSARALWDEPCEAVEDRMGERDPEDDPAPSPSS